MPKLTVNVSDSCVKIIEAHATIYDYSRTEAIRAAFALLGLFDSETAKGNKILIETGPGKFRRITGM